MNDHDSNADSSTNGLDSFDSASSSAGLDSFDSASGSAGLDSFDSASGSAGLDSFDSASGSAGLDSFDSASGSAGSKRSDIYEADDFYTTVPDFSRSLRHRASDIPIDLTPNARRGPQYRVYEDLADDSDAETVHHVINVRPYRSIDNCGNKEQNWPGRKAFTHQSSFNQDEKASLETYRIVQSRLIPRSEDYLHDRAILTYEGKTASSETEIRWVDSTKTLKMEALRQQNVPEATSTLIRSAFRYLRQRNEKSYVHGRFLDPTALSFVARDDDGERLPVQELASVAFLAFPYFTLEPLRVQDPTSAEPIHPVRSLLQCHYSFQSTGQRDTDQVVCKVREVPDVLHVPQTWMLLVNEDLILSMGPNDLAHIGGEYVSLERAKAGGEMTQIRLIDFEGKQYFLPKRSCKTWLEFITLFSTVEKDETVVASFMDGSWSDEYELRLGNELISEENWSEIVLHSEKDITIHIVEKPPRSLPYHRRSSRAHSRTDFGHRQRSRSARSTKYDNMMRRKSYTYSASNTTPDDILIRHSTSTNNGHRDDSDSIRQSHTNVVKRHAWQSDKKPIRLKDLDGFELTIPWRVGRTWQKMHSVIDTKMQKSYESRHAYTNGDYILNGPDGPITPADWDEKILPGCTVELKLTGPETTGRRSRPRSRQRGSRPFPDDENSVSTVVQSFLFTPTPPERIDGSYLIEYPGNSSYSALARDADPQTPRESNESAGDQSIADVVSGPNLTTSALQPEPSSQMALVLWRQSPLNSNTSIHTATGEQLGGILSQSRRSTDPLGFFEDFFEDTVEDSIHTERHSPEDSVDNLPPVERTSSDSWDISSTTRSDEVIRQDSSSQLASLEEPAADPQPDNEVDTTPMCPIFAWEVAASDDLPPTLAETSASVFGHKDANRAIRAILEEREAEATLYLLKHERENDFFDSLSRCSREKVLAEMEVAGTTLDQSSTIERSARRKSTRKKLSVITNAIEILDAFVPVQHHNINQYWLIGKFYGALLSMTSSYFSDAYLDRIGNRGVDGQSWTFYLPKALVDAFNPMIIYVCICSQVSDEFQPEWGLQRHARKILKSLKTAEYQLISMIHAGDFSEAKVFRRVNAQDIVTMVTERLVRIPNENPNGIPSSDGFNLLQIYRQYILGLELQVRTSPNAEIFDEIQRLREELNIVHTVLDQQLEVLHRLRRVWARHSHSSNQVSLPSIYQSRKLITKMKRDLDELEDMAGRTSTLLRSMIEVRKESNSKAIAIFTVVTVIFLPLSFVTSYLGMNSVDIRDGTFNQSLFWIVALPSAAVLIFTLWMHAEQLSAHRKG
ncbi:Mg2+ transporter protein CorA-like/Zinc transport protein ZntB [Penicillium cf. griseofulvum]|nr:Mg2+ transporter protein CorA-like/Zinc transport protein ZntB [Penicillium cf. griseofulvum]